LKVFYLRNERYFVLQSEPSLEEKIQKKDMSDKPPVLVAESELDEAAKAYLLQFSPETQTLEDDPRILDLMDTYDQQTSDFLRAISVIKIDYQVFMNKVLAQSDDVDDIEMLELQKTREETNRIQKSNLELKEQNQQYQLANTELRRRLEEVNQMLKEAIQRSDKRNSDTESNKNEQQISYGKNLGSVLGESPQRASNISNIPEGQRSASELSRAQSDGKSDGSDDKQAAIEHIKGTIVMIMKRTPVIDQQAEQIVPILFSILGLSTQEVEEINDARARLSVYKIDEKATKKALKELEKKS